MRVAVAAAVVAIALTACAGDDASVRFVSPDDGDVVASPVQLELAASGLRIEPAGPIHRDAGHFHVMVDRDCFREGAFVEMHTAGFEHLGDGTSKIAVALPPGRHTLCLQVGNGAHVTLAPTDRITVTVR